MAMAHIDRLESLLDRQQPVLIQTHDFPDHDALGAACGLCELLLRHGFDARMVYGGLLQSISLQTMIDRLEIPVERLETNTGSNNFQTIVVDGSPVNRTVRQTAGPLIGVIDHHPARRALHCPFVDIRPQMGSCSAIIWQYWKEANETPDRTTATALLAGIQLDTDFLSRRVTPDDLEAHYHLFTLADVDLAREVVRTSMDVTQLPIIGDALRTCYINGTFLYTELCGDYTSELLSVLADFLLRLREITFVVVAEIRGTEYHLSARTRDRTIDAGFVVRTALEDIGSGGGHPHMAGGVMKAEAWPGREEMIKRLETAITAMRSIHETDNQTD